MNLRTAPRPKAKFGWANVLQGIGTVAGALDGNIDNWLGVGNNVANVANGISAMNNITPAINVSGMPQIGINLARYGGCFGKRRPKAWVGALIGTAASLIGSGLAAREAAKEQEAYLAEQNRQAQARSDANQASAITSILNSNRSLTDQDWEGYNQAINYRAGGNTKKRKHNYKTIEAENGEVIKTDKPFKVTDGGMAEPLGNNTFLLRGASHDQINESGNTGIGLKVQDAKILSDKLNINGATPAQQYVSGIDDFDDLFIQQESAKANADLNNVALQDLIKLEQAKNKKYGIDPSKRSHIDVASIIEDETPLKYGGRIIPSPVKKVGVIRPKAETGDWVGYETITGKKYVQPTWRGYDLIMDKDNNTTTSTVIPKSETQNAVDGNVGNPYYIKDNPYGWTVNKGDWINFGTDLLGSVSGAILSKNAYDNIDYTKGLQQVSYNPVIATPLETRYRVGAQFANLDRTRNFNNRAIANNSSNSLIAREAIQRNNNDITSKQNELLDTKANKEVELRNANLKNIQQVAFENAKQQAAINQFNAAAYNSALEKNNALRSVAGEKYVANLEGIGQAFSNMWNRGRDRFEDNRANLYNLLRDDNPGNAIAANTAGLLNKNDRYALYNMELAKYKGYTDKNSVEARQSSERLNYWKKVLGIK